MYYTTRILFFLVFTLKKKNEIYERFLLFIFSYFFFFLFYSCYLLLPFSPCVCELLQKRLLSFSFFFDFLLRLIESSGYAKIYYNFYMMFSSMPFFSLLLLLFRVWLLFHFKKNVDKYNKKVNINFCFISNFSLFTWQMEISMFLSYLVRKLTQKSKKKNRSNNKNRK